MDVIRTMPDTGWTPIANTALRDPRLSWRARGLLGELMSYPSGWETNVDKLVDMSARADDSHTEGRDAMRTAMRELVKYGYVERARRSDEAGRWSTRVRVIDCSDRRTEMPSSVIQASVDQPSVDQASLQRQTTKTDTKKDLCRDEEDKQQPESGEGRLDRIGDPEVDGWPEVAQIGDDCDPEVWRPLAPFYDR